MTEYERIELIARQIDQEVWDQEMPELTRDGVLDWHARMQRSCEIARRIIVALDAHVKPTRLIR